MRLHVFLSIFHQRNDCKYQRNGAVCYSYHDSSGNFMAVNRNSGNTAAALRYCLALTSISMHLLELLGLYHKVDIPDTGLKVMFVYIGISSILIYVDQKLHPGHRSVKCRKTGYSALKVQVMFTFRQSEL
jgi:hypothetical protein